ncbi:hypothetical protein PJIAN_3651 [Paludibacter jiangxiensis]|uniref:Uncharacterized protein n=1 Tax=Paludibacter jiangxiensis TaxID=681398 RepID=A0A171A6I5_9BACT|nr:hypothetical protein PJIAN_3651 [Paludibacter jiangxiensis]
MFNNIVFGHEISGLLFGEIFMLNNEFSMQHFENEWHLIL